MLFNLCVHDAGGVSNLGFFPFYSVKVNIIYMTPLLCEIQINIRTERESTSYLVLDISMKNDQS
jgi:hypothetical protein